MKIKQLEWRDTGETFFSPVVNGPDNDMLDVPAYRIVTYAHTPFANYMILERDGNLSIRKEYNNNGSVSWRVNVPKDIEQMKEHAQSDFEDMVSRFIDRYIEQSN